MPEVKGIPHMKRPCPECPWRVDSPPDQFESCRFDALRATTGSAGSEAHFGSPLFACHKTTEGRDAACAGWLAVAGYENLSVRFAVITGLLPDTVLRPGADWPDLYGSYDEMAAAKGEIDA